MAVIEFPMKRHPEDDQLEGYSLEILSQREIARLEEHFLICETCQERLTEMDTYVEAMRAALMYRREQSSRRPATKPALAPAGSPE
jgi:hypothetical protein